MPVAIATPRRSPSTSGAPASCHASRAATIAYWPDGSSFLASCRASTSVAGVASVQANVTGSSYLTTQSSSRGRAPERPASAASHELVASPPSGVVAPIPVTTTVRWPDMVCLLGGGGGRAVRRDGHRPAAAHD